MKTRRIKGTVEPFSLIIVAICICVGGYFAIFSKVIDSPIEQADEAILRAEGVDVDFSAEKKQEVKASNAVSQVQSQAHWCR